jgi:hypothetical protein
MKRLRCTLLPILLAGLFFMGCENQIEAPEAMTLQAKNAVEVLPAGAQFVSMVNLQAMQHNTLFDPFDIESLSGEFGARVQEFLDATGLDPENDLHEVYVASAGMGPDAQPSIVAYVTFDRDRLQDYIDQRLGETFERDDYKGIPIYRALEDGHSIIFALAADNMIVASPDEASVEAMLDRLSGTGRALKDDAETMNLIALASSGSNAWAVFSNFDEINTRKSQHEDAIGRDMEQIGQALKDVAVSLTMQQDGAEGTVIMNTKDGVSTDDLAALTKGVVAAMKASSKMGDAELQMLDRVRVRTQGDQVRVNFFVNNEMLASSR